MPSATPRSTTLTRPDGLPLAIHVPTQCAAGQRAHWLSLIRRNGGSEAHRIGKADLLLFDLDTPAQSKQMMRSTAGFQPPIPAVTAQWLEDSVQAGALQDIGSSAYNPAVQLKLLEARQAHEASEAHAAARQEALQDQPQEAEQEEEEEEEQPPPPPVQRPAPAAAARHVPSKS